MLVRVATLLTTIVGSGCGTVMTTGERGTAHIESAAFAAQTHCQTIPRVYGGVAYDACTSLFHDTKNDAAFQEWKLPFYLLDSAASAVADTVLLPYTVYLQYTQGSLRPPQAS